MPISIGCLLACILFSLTTANQRVQQQTFNYNRILWCQQSSESPQYDLSTGANCPKLSPLITNPKSYHDFRKVFCVLKKYYQQIKYKHVQKIKYGTSKFANLAYHTLKWSIINLKPDPDLLWLEFGVANGYSINLTSYLKEKVLKSAAPTIYGFDWFEGLPEKWCVLLSICSCYILYSSYLSIISTM
jgi:hypothetical protein